MEPFCDCPAIASSWAFPALCVCSLVKSCKSKINIYAYLSIVYLYCTLYFLVFYKLTGRVFFCILRIFLSSFYLRMFGKCVESAYILQVFAVYFCVIFSGLLYIFMRVCGKSAMFFCVNVGKL